MKRLWPLIALGLGAFVIFALVTLPASVVLSRLGSAGIAAAGVSGSIWNGKAQVLQVGGVPVGSVEWNLHVLPLFTLHANADVKVSRVDGFATTAVSIGPGGNVTLKGLTASLPLQALPNIAPGWAATLNGKFTKLTLDKGWPIHVDGSLDAIDVTGPARKPANVGSYRLIFDPTASTAEMIQGAISDSGDGPLQINGTVRLKTDRSYEIDALVATRANAPRNLASALEYLGPPDAQGRRQFSMAGAL
ncbi:MAG: type II secretion system protein N [Steroidobacter sp.]